MASRRQAPAEPARTSRSHDRVPPARPGDLRVPRGQRIPPTAHSVTSARLRGPRLYFPKCVCYTLRGGPRSFPPRDMFPGSSTVEHSAVNRRVASSNLARGATFSEGSLAFARDFACGLPLRSRPQIGSSSNLAWGANSLIRGNGPDPGRPRCAAAWFVEYDRRLARGCPFPALDAEC